MKVLLLPILLCSFVSVSAQQQSSRFRIGVEYGITPLAGEIDDRWEFRQPKSSYPTYGFQENVNGEGEIHYFGLRMEFPLAHKRFTIASGLRYNRVNQRIRSESDLSHLYLFHPSDQGIDLFRIHGIDESLGYLSIPLEMEMLLWGIHGRWQGYLKGGIQAGIKIHGNTMPDFVSKEMEKHKEDALSGIGAPPAPFFANVYASFGIRYIFRNQLSLSIENTTSHIFLTRDNFSLLTPQTLPGVQLRAAIPVGIFFTK